MSSLHRREFLVGIPVGCITAGALGGWGRAPGRAGADSVYPEFPSHDPKLVQEVVGASHGNIDVVRELVKARPALAKASWDWGFGDWESALGAASHVGRRDIAELLIGHGARPNLFTFAMFDQVDAVRASIQANPGIERIHGPHGITLLSHARAGKAERVIEYLESVPGANVPQPAHPLDAAMKAAFIGVYIFGSGAEDTFRVSEMNNGLLGLRRGERSPRPLFHIGDHEFVPTGSKSVRISFSMSDAGAAETLTIHDADLVVTARRVP